MPRLFCKIVVALFFVLAGLVVLAAEIVTATWLVDRYPGTIAWIAYVLFGLVDIPILMAVWGFAAQKVREA